MTHGLPIDFSDTDPGTLSSGITEGKCEYTSVVVKLTNETLFALDERAAHNGTSRDFEVNLALAKSLGLHVSIVAPTSAAGK